MTCYVIWCRFDAGNSLEGSAIRHGMPKKEDRIPQLHSGRTIQFDGEERVTIQCVYVTVHVYI